MNLSNVQKDEYDLVEKNIGIYIDLKTNSVLSIAFSLAWKTIDEKIFKILKDIESTESNLNIPKVRKLSELDNYY